MASVTPVVTAVAAKNILLKGSAGVLDSLFVSSSASGYALVYDAAGAPADGTVTPLLCFPLLATGGAYATAQVFPNPVRFVNGCVVVCSSTGPFTQTSQTTAFIAGQAE